MRGLSPGGNNAPVPARVTVSIGMTTLVPSEDHTTDVFLEAADQALYEAKRRGRDQMIVSVDDSLEERLRGDFATP